MNYTLRAMFAAATVSSLLALSTAFALPAGAAAPSPWITITWPNGQPQVRIRFLDAYQTPHITCLGPCDNTYEHGDVTGDFLVLTMRVHSVSREDLCKSPAGGLMCAGEFDGLFAFFGSGTMKQCSAGSTLPAYAGPGVCSRGTYCGKEGFFGGDLDDPSTVVGNFTPGKTITYNYVVELALNGNPNIQNTKLHSLADIWLSLDGSACGSQKTLVSVASLWPNGRIVNKALVPSTGF